MISQTSEYALRAVVFLAARPANDPATASDISEATRVPAGYLQKILRTLARHGILTARRGTNGGFALAKVPTAISILDVLKASEAQIRRIERCPLGIDGHTSLCALHALLDAEMARVEGVFASTSLADLLGGEGGQRPLCDHSGSMTSSVPITTRRAAKNSEESDG